MKKILVFLCLFAAFSFANAQNSTYDDSQWPQNRIGLYGSFFSGYGLSYQYQFANGLSVRTQLFAYGSNDDNNYNSDEIQLALGADLQYNLKRTHNTRLYALAGSFIDYYERGNSYYSSSVYSKDYNIERFINVGVGFGIEILGWQNVSIVLEGGYYGRFGNNTVTDYDYSGEETKRVKVNQTPKSFGFGVGGGISYAF
ncbi:MAG: hypothetical protein CVV25_03060 [Ignavibacteriae bacterium HGW-Ignavibacteriae-4]|jgi:hypothetical protein|nr:MAG: hypothetical protein CVV25_03060 [Ignavibacteriae bacterium HGW-Ignavibacteriae-4]